MLPEMLMSPDVIHFSGTSSVMTSAKGWGSNLALMKSLADLELEKEKDPERHGAWYQVVVFRKGLPSRGYINDNGDSPLRRWFDANRPDFARYLYFPRKPLQ